jgi:hypothetical protein
MKIIGVACVRDEEDVIEAFVRHNLAFLDRLIVLDNGSSDGTWSILNALKEEGLPLDLLQDPTPGKYLSQRMTRLMRENAVGQHGADWVLPLDADEFVGARDDRLISDAAESDKPLALPWRSYLPHESDEPGEINPVVRLRHRLQDEPNAIIKVVVPSKLAGQANVMLEQGNHELSIDGRAVEPVRQLGAWLSHYPVRSRGQFIAKTVIGHLQNLAMPFHDPRRGVHHRTYFEMLQCDPYPFAGDFARWIRIHGVYRFDGKPDTISDPLDYRGGTLRHTPAIDDTARSWQRVMGYGQDLARRYGLMKASLPEGQQTLVEQQLHIFGYFREQLDQRERHLAALRCEAREHQEQHHSAQLRTVELQHQLQAARDQLVKTEQKLAASESALANAQTRVGLEVERVERKFLQSRTWIAGRFALWPARLLRSAWSQLRA